MIWLVKRPETKSHKQLHNNLHQFRSSNIDLHKYIQIKVQIVHNISVMIHYSRFAIIGPYDSFNSKYHTFSERFSTVLWIEALNDSNVLEQRSSVNLVLFPLC